MIPRLAALPAPLPLVAAFFAELRLRGFSGGISEASDDRAVLATDNSIYQLAPQAVAWPRGIDDLVRIARALDDPRFGAVKIAPRGGGTGTNGQSLTDGVAVDLSRHMTRILEIDPARGFARVEAGVVKDELNAALAPHGFFFAPELSTSNRATIGGMISTDACGQGSCLYGKTRDHVLELKTVLSDGTVFTSAPIDDAELARLRARPDRVGAVHRAVDDVAREQAEAIAARFPKLNRSLTGYDLAHIRDAEGRFDLNAVLCGSEGTLGFVAEAKLRILPVPRHSALVAIRYGSFDAALRDARALMGLGAASIETVDSKVLALAQEDLVWDGVRAFFPEDGGERARGVNLVEFVGQDAEAVEAAVRRLAMSLAADPPGAARRGFAVARGAVEVGRIWAMRKKAVGLLGATRGERRPVAFVEDTAVPPENLADFIADFRAALDRRGLAYGMFGHVDAGVLHVRPALDLKDPADERMIREVTEEVAALVRRYGGLLWGEHGKGFRSEFSPAVFGPLYPSLQAIKAAFDPNDQFNPGKVASAAANGLSTIDGVPLKGQADRAIPAAVRAGFDEALHCNGNGACFTWDPDEAMCPSYKGTRDRRHSPKGRAQLLREWLRRLAAAGVDPVAEAERLRARPAWRQWAARWRTDRSATDFSHEVKAALDGCLACKACVGQCPVKVDVPTFRAKFLELYHGRYPRPWRDHLVGGLEALLPILARAPRLANALEGGAVGRSALRRLGLVATPALSGLDARREAARLGAGLATPAALNALAPETRRRSVVIVQDAFTSHYDTPLLLDLVRVLKALGVRPWLAPFRPNGKPLHVLGFLGAFARTAARNAALLEALAATGVDLVGLDPAMTLTYRAEYPAALGREGPPVRLLQDWLAEHLDGATAAPRAAEGAPPYLLLPHCTERTAAQPSLGAWRRVFEHVGLALEILPAGCCGMAGTYGHEAEHRATSERIYALSWGPHVARAAGTGRLLADGYSCRSQVRIIDGVALPHPVSVLRRALVPA